MAYGRDASHDDTDWGSILFWGTVAVGGAFAFKKFVLDAQAQAAPALPGQAPPRLPPPGVIIPPGTPGGLPGPIPTTPSEAGEAATIGDTILVDVSALGGDAQLEQLAGDQPEIQMTVVAAVPGLPTVLATVNDPLVANAPVTPFSVPRSAIVNRQAGTLPAIPGLPPAPTPVPGGSPVPTIPGLPGLAFLPQDLGNPMPLKQGHHYRARVQLDGLEATLASPQMVASQFQALGFSDVKIYKGGVDALPPDWPAVTIIAPTNGTYYGEGTWTPADTSVPRPPQIVAAWEQ